MKLPIIGGVITAGFNQMRPLSNPVEHKHGGLDIIGGDGIVRAPASGTLHAYAIIRPEGWAWDDKDKPEILSIPVRDYFYDLFGGVITITEPCGRIHVLAHFWAAALQRRFGPLHYCETYRKTRYPAIVLSTTVQIIGKHNELLAIGNAGYSTGAHLHWEVHPGPGLATYADRIDPATLIEE